MVLQVGTTGKDQASLKEAGFRKLRVPTCAQPSLGISPVTFAVYPFVVLIKQQQLPSAERVALSAQ